jgi:cytidylate kinase
LPDAPLKLYVTASAEERARRRWLEKQDRGDDSSAYTDILADIKRRDAIDSGRQHSPLRAAEDAIIVDTTEKSPDELLAEILALPFFDTILMSK